MSPASSKKNKEPAMTETRTITDIDVAIIGAGPSGLSAAIELAKLGQKNTMVFDREAEAGGVPRHCAHTGFGIAEFKRPMTGPDYARKLVETAQRHNVALALLFTLIEIDGDLLVFSTPKGIKYYRARRTLLALGARETPRPARLVSGIRSPNIITTGALQRFVHLHGRAPFERAVIVGSESVSFSAILTCRHAGIDIAAMVEEAPRIQMFAPLKPATELLLKIPVHTGVERVTIEGENQHISGVTLHKDGRDEFVACDGVIFSGRFTPEGAIMQSTFEHFNHRNNSAHVTQNFQTTDPRFFVTGNALRGALAAFKCHAEGRQAARSLHASLGDDTPPRTVTIEADDAIAWLSPSLIDLDAPHPQLTTLRFRHATQGTLLTLLNGREVMRTRIDAVPFLNITLPWFDQEVHEGDRVELHYYPA
jgi:thioredoxin reductase